MKRGYVCAAFLSLSVLTCAQAQAGNWIDNSGMVTLPPVTISELSTTNYVFDWNKLGGTATTPLNKANVRGNGLEFYSSGSPPSSNDSAAWAASQQAASSNAAPTIQELAAYTAITNGAAYQDTTSVNANLTQIMPLGGSNRTDMTVGANDAYTNTKKPEMGLKSTVGQTYSYMSDPKSLVKGQFSFPADYRAPDQGLAPDNRSGAGEVNGFGKVENQNGKAKYSQVAQEANYIYGKFNFQGKPPQGSGGGGNNGGDGDGDSGGDW